MSSNFIYYRFCPSFLKSQKLVVGPSKAYLNGYALSKEGHTHSGYASSSHTHTPTSIGAAASSHTHSEYASFTHNHDSIYAALNHTHGDTYASIDYVDTIFGASNGVQYSDTITCNNRLNGKPPLTLYSKTFSPGFTAYSALITWNTYNFNTSARLDYYYSNGSTSTYNMYINSISEYKLINGLKAEFLLLGTNTQIASIYVTLSNNKLTFNIDYRSNGYDSYLESYSSMGYYGDWYPISIPYTIKFFP